MTTLKSDDQNVRYELSSVWPLQAQTIMMNFNLWAPCSFIEYLHICFWPCVLIQPLFDTPFTLSYLVFQPLPNHIIFIWLFDTSDGGPFCFSPHLLLWFIILLFYISFPNQILHFGFGVTFYNSPCYGLFLHLDC